MALQVDHATEKCDLDQANRRFQDFPTNGFSWGIFGQSALNAAVSGIVAYGLR
jgi:hypothetical protein